MRQVVFLSLAAPQFLQRVLRASVVRDPQRHLDRFSTRPL